MDEIPFYYKDMAGFENRIVYYESSRGCPFSCSYCLSSIDKSVRFRSLSLVKKELDFFLERKVPQVKFVDRTFNCRREHTLGIWKHILDHDNGVTNFHFEVSADLFDQEELEMIGPDSFSWRSASSPPIRIPSGRSGGKWTLRSLRPLWTGSMDTGIPTSIWI